MQLLRVVDPPSSFSNRTKTAARIVLGDNPATYQSEITAQLYKQHPYLGKYQIALEIINQDDARGYMYGVFTVRAPSYSPTMSADPRQSTPQQDPGFWMPQQTQMPQQQMQQQQQMPQPGGPPPGAEQPMQPVRIPVIVNNKKVASFDVFITSDGKFLPLSETRLAQVMFDANLFAVTAPPAGGGPQSFSYNDFAGNGGGVGGSMRSSAYSGDNAVKIGSLLSRLHPDETAVSALLEDVGNDEWLRQTALSDPFFGTALEKAAAATQSAHTATEVPTPDFGDVLVLIRRGGGGVTLLDMEKTAELSPREVAQLDVSLRQRLFEDNVVLLSPPSDISEVKQTAYEKVASTRMCRVLRHDGAYDDALVITDVLRLDGGREDAVVVLSNNLGSGFQESVAGDAGTPVKLASLGVAPTAEHGEGVFFFPSTGFVSEPLTIRTSIDNADGVRSYIVDTTLETGATLTRTKIGSLRKVAHGEFLLPENAVFVQQQFRGSFVKTAAGIPNETPDAVSLRYVDGRFGFDIPGIEDDRTYGVEETLLTLGLLGADDLSAKHKMAEAMDTKVASFIPSKKTRMKKRPQKCASVRISEEELGGIRLNLVKEAAALSVSGSPDSLDAVLSLNFITPDNVTHYVDSLASFEDAATNLAELLIGVRLGLQDVPEDAVSSALNGIERAITGLKKLQIRLAG
jgi:hypothetical protein